MYIQFLPFKPARAETAISRYAQIYPLGIEYGEFPSHLWIQVGYFSQASLFATSYFDHPWSFAMVKCVVFVFFFPHQVKFECFCDVSKIHLVSVIKQRGRPQKRDRLTPGHSEVVVPLCWATRTGEQSVACYSWCWSCWSVGCLSIKTCGVSQGWYGYGSIPIHTIFRGMNIHLPAILMFTRGTRFWHTAIYSIKQCLISWLTNSGWFVDRWCMGKMCAIRGAMSCTQPI